MTVVPETVPLKMPPSQAMKTVVALAKTTWCWSAWTRPVLSYPRTCATVAPLFADWYASRPATKRFAGLVDDAPVRSYFRPAQKFVAEPPTTPPPSGVRRPKTERGD